MNKFGLAGLLATTCLLAVPAFGADMTTEDGTTPGPMAEFYAAVGVVGIEAREHVFDGAGSTDNLSLLVWQSVAPIFTAGVDVDLPDNWTVSAKAQIAMSGDSYMEDFDWLLPYRTSFDADAWTDRSQHEDTTLDWYFNGSVALGHDFNLDEKTTVNLNAGFKYTDVQWAARGGTYVYSDAGFRDTSGTFPDVPGITYRQQLPSVFIGLDSEIVQDDWTFNLGAQAGITFLAKAVDHHWMRDLRFEETVDPAPVLAASAAASRKLTDTSEFFIAAGVEKTFLGRSDTTIYDDITNANLGTYVDESGAELLAGHLSIGIKGSF